MTDPEHNTQKTVYLKQTSIASSELLKKLLVLNKSMMMKGPWDTFIEIKYVSKYLL